MTDDEKIKELQREKARVLEEAATAAAAIEREIEERKLYARLAEKYGPSSPPQATAGTVVRGQTVESLIDRYQTDADSPYRKITYKSRQFYDSILSLIRRDYGPRALCDLGGRDFLNWHKEWAAGGRYTIAHSKIGMLRMLFTFGKSILGDKDCVRLSDVLSGLRFEVPRKRTQQLTTEHANAIRMKAHEMGRSSIALTQALQFDGKLRQKDVLGEWVPMSEPGDDKIVFKNKKWRPGLRWEDIDANLMLRISPGKGHRVIEVNLRQAPMVMDEFRRIRGFDGGRKSLPALGPVVLYEKTKQPWSNNEFRRYWRQIADAAGVPKDVKNMDSRGRAAQRRTQPREVDETIWGAEVDPSAPRH